MSTNTKRLVIAVIVLLTAAAGVFYVLSVHSSRTSMDKNEADTLQVNASLKESEYYFSKANRTNTDLDSALLAIGNAYRISKKADYPKGLGLSFDLYSKVYNAKGDTTRGRQYADSAIAVLKAHKLYYNLGFAYFNRSGFYPLYGEPLKRRIAWVKLAAEAFAQSGITQKQSDIYKELADLQQINAHFDEALKNLHLSLSLCDTTNYGALTGIYDLLGSIYSKIGSQHLGLKYGLQVLKYMKLSNDTTSATTATLYNRIGNSYEILEKHQVAYKYYEKGERIARLNNDSARWCIIIANKTQSLYLMKKYREAAQCLMKIPENSLNNDQDIDRRGRVHSLFLRCYVKLKDYNECRRYVDLLTADLRYYRKAGYTSISAPLSLAEYYTEIHDLKNAEVYLKICDQAYWKLNLLPYPVNSYRQRIKVDSARGDLITYIKHLKELLDRRDSLTREETAREIVQLEAYETEKKTKDILLKEDRIKLLDAENRIQQADLGHAMLARNVTIVGIILLAIIVVLLYNRYRFNNRINRTITERNNALNQLVIEKEWLLKEIHHRVKNNLQIIISLLDSQSMYLRDSSAISAIRDSQSRVYCMSLIHKKLYQSYNIATIKMDQYIEELVDYLANAFGIQHIITFNLDIADIQLSASQSIPIGLILNEAITNSIKYAFPGQSKGNRINIRLSADGNQCTLIIHDNGIGLPEGFNQENATTLGTSLMKGLSEDIEASFSMENRDGTYVKITFAMEQIVLTETSPEESLTQTPTR